MLNTCLTLAQTAAEQQMAAILKWLGVICVVAVLLAVAGLMLRRLLRPAPDDSPSLGTGFTLADLRQMHRDGQLTDEEFAAAKAKMIALSRAALREDEAVTELSTTDAPPDSPDQGPENLEDGDRADNPDDDGPPRGDGSTPA